MRPLEGDFCGLQEELAEMAAADGPGHEKFIL